MRSLQVDLDFPEPGSTMSQLDQRFLTPAARAVDLTKSYGTGDGVVRALDGVNVRFARGGFTAVMCPSGSGKSTLMHCMAGLDVPTSGRAFVGDEEIGLLDDADLTDLRRDRIGFVFQSFNLVPTLSAAENITLPLDLVGDKVDRAWFEHLVKAIGCRTVPVGCPVASSSVSPVPGR
jgi:putative ABC transport system ATP-binding protein